MPISWSSENYVKLLAALLAAHPALKPDYKAMAVYFGDGATYDAIQGCMRPIRKRAEKLRQEVEGGMRPDTPPRPTPKKRGAGGGSSSKGKARGLFDDEVDDEEPITPAKKKARMIEGSTPTPTPTKSTNGRGNSRGRSGKGTPAKPMIIDLLDSDDDSNIRPVTASTPVKGIEQETKVEVKSESKLSNGGTGYNGDSEDDYRE
ncbi:hypothetical protein Dda_3016 [Drechslerella dactyloides]|uniref:Uncharacterized protein n=1 Tax=Drechslerella dactyloides TaxID=74499 RepID=A0AAD6NJY0_DREDA|nr:hypothetical protein Dda_3016 [Drechslerella dactyloides]